MCYFCVRKEETNIHVLAQWGNYTQKGNRIMELFVFTVCGVRWRGQKKMGNQGHFCIILALRIMLKFHMLQEEINGVGGVETVSFSKEHE